MGVGAQGHFERHFLAADHGGLRALCEESQISRFKTSKDSTYCLALLFFALGVVISKPMARDAAVRAAVAGFLAAARRKAACEVWNAD